MKKILVLCTTDSMIWNFLVPHIKALEKQGYTVECACSVTGNYFDDLKKIHNLKMNRFNFKRSPYKLSNFTELFRLCRFIKNKKFDVVFCHEPVGGVMGRIAGKINSCKVIYMAHGFHFHKRAPIKNWLIYYPVEKILSYMTDTIITINKEDYKLAKKSFHSKKTSYVPGVGIDLNKFGSSDCDIQSKRKEAGVPEGAVWILSVGELIPRKNHETLIKAVKNIDNVCLTIVGDGELKEYLNKLINDLDMTDKVKLLGYRNDINELNIAADIFAFPSFQEGLPVALMEAMASGLSVVCSRIRGNTDLIRNGKGGVMFDPSSVEDTENALKKLSGSGQLREKMGNFNKTAIQKYELNNAVNAFMNVFNDI